MLAQLSDRTHEVWTGVALLAQGSFGVRAEVAASCTLVRFRRLTRREIEAYAASGEGLDKAGGYAIQGQAGHFVAELQGSLSNVIGLPLDLVAKLYSRLTGEPIASPEPPLWFKAPLP
jgi:septum formation protein